MERICVCGLGRVGLPLLEMLRYIGFQAIGYDLDPAKTECNGAEAVDRSDAAIFIVQTPSNPDGSFSNAHLFEALERFSRHAAVQKKHDYLYIIGSTTTPGSCNKFLEMVGPNICYKPEFIRLADVRRDLLNPAIVLIGSNHKGAGDQCEEIYKRVTSAPVKRMSMIEAELAKITLNCALTMKISLANQLHLVAKELGADSSIIMDAVGSDPRIGNAYLKPGSPYGGPCLPRDNRMFQYVAKTVGVDACLSAAADQINESEGIGKLKTAEVV
jgi:UDPglucose 6-dehydrogenase